MAVAAIFFTIIAALVAAVAGFLYFVGIPAEWKQAASEAAVRNMGENAASDIVKDQMDKIPEADRKNVEKGKKALSGLTGGKVDSLFGE